MQNYFGKWSAEVRGPKQAQHSFVINGRASRQACKLCCKCLEKSLSTMLEKLWLFLSHVSKFGKVRLLHAFNTFSPLQMIWNRKKKRVPRCYFHSFACFRDRIIITIFLLWKEANSINLSNPYSWANIHPTVVLLDSRVGSFQLSKVLCLILLSH